jgi:MoxR-like ATPase
MSSLWTPGGEVPIDRGGTAEDRRSGREPEPESERARPEEGITQEELERMRRQLLEVPAADVVAQHAAALYELAALHLSEPEPRLTEARLAIDALAALVEGLPGRLGQAEDALTEALPQLKMAYVEAADRA